MTTDKRSLLALAIWMLFAVAAPVVMGQAAEEDDTEDSATSRLLVEITAWMAQPVGTELEPATLDDPTNPFLTETLRARFGTEAEGRYRVGYNFGKNLGALAFTYYAHNSDFTLSGRSPGTFGYGEIQAHPLFAGLNYDGHVDSFDAEGRVRLFDARLDYYRTAIKNRRIEAKWYVGVRRVQYKRTMSTLYSTLISGLPPLLPPLTEGGFPGLDPAPDNVAIESDYEGRGITGGFDIKMPLYRDRLFFDAGFALGALRGKTNASYRSTTNYYTLTAQGQEFILLPPFDDAWNTDVPQQGGTTAPLVNNIGQRSLQLGLTATSRDTTSAVIETYFGFRYRAYKQLYVILGFRDLRLDDVAVDLKPVVVVSNLAQRTVGIVDGATDPVQIDPPPDETSKTFPVLDGLDSDGNLQGINLANSTEVDRSVTYEGFYLGVSWSF